MAESKKTDKATAEKAKPAIRKSRGSTFDVVPPGKVIPTASARPVITATEPQQADSTLVQPASAPLVHKPMVLQPLAKTEAQASKADKPAPNDESDHDIAASLGATLEDGSEPAPSAPEVPAVLGEDKPDKADKPAGRSVDELLAARKAAAESPQKDDDAKPVAAAASEPETEPEPESKPESGPEPESVAADDTDSTDEPVKEPVDDAKPADQPNDPSDQVAGELADLGKDSKTDDLLAPAELYGGKPVIVVHEAHPVRSAIKALVLFLLVLGLALVVLNFLLDAGVVSLGIELPHTDLLEP